ncbi:hypothetical protein KOW79_021677 [Hemibagrus wyckioides]|uniref:Uncharacterized protein n=1 Tax=Hemibagrus wyckioides TaxID=337641 RepID=A0A9D3SD36_9TELE|nr:hypothetical protein KOW79_021677 [Hemibagrus wyckioides]
MVRGVTDTPINAECPGTLELGGDSTEGNLVLGTGDTGRDTAESGGEGLNTKVADECSQPQGSCETCPRVQREVPVLAVRRSKRATAGVHVNPFHAPRAACLSVMYERRPESQVFIPLDKGDYYYGGAVIRERPEKVLKLVKTCRMNLDVD